MISTSFKVAKKRLIVILAVFALIFCIPLSQNEHETRVKACGSEIEYDSSLEEGTRSIKQSCVDGEEEIDYKVVRVLGIEASRSILKSATTKESQPEIVVVGTKKYYKCSDGTKFDNEYSKDECEKKIAWQTTRDNALAECKANSAYFNCWYDNYPGTTLHYSYHTYDNYSEPEYRSGAICRDGTSSTATGRGVCSHHGGVRTWI